MTKQHDQTKKGTNKQHNQLKPARIDKSVPKHCDPKACLDPNWIVQETSRFSVLCFLTIPGRKIGNWQGLLL